MNNSTTDDLPTCSHIISTILASTISLVSVASFIGNSLVTITFLMDTSLRTSTNYFIVNMAISDLLISLTNWPLSATEGILPRKHMIEGSTATFVCKFGHYFRAISQAVSVLSLLLIVVDRYIAIVLPFQSILVTSRRRAAFLLFTWIFPLLIAFPYVWTSKIVIEGHQTDCRTFVSWNKIERAVFYAVGFLIFYCVPLISIIVLYSRIMKSLRRARPGEEGQKRQNTKKRSLHQNRIVMTISICIVSAFFLCWTPLCVYIVLKKIFPASFFVEDPCMLLISLFFYVFPTLSTVLNPLIIFVSSSRFSRAFKEMFSRWLCNLSQCCKDNSPQGDVVQMQVR